jgi:peptidoglycan hydrolase-like protein with peptidoglycan-binding domain
MKTAKAIIELAKSWIGRNENDGTHKYIIDIYNNHKPLARGYKVKYTDSWCATTISALAIKLGYTDIIPTECGCQQMIQLFKNIGSWVEDENRTPNPGDIIFYDWEDDCVGDNQGWSDHVGIVEKVANGVIVIIEGNYVNSVKRRTLEVNGKYIRGYGVPKYDAEATPKLNAKILEWQKAAIADGFTFPKYGADGEWGSECENVAKKAVIKKRIVYIHRNLTKIIQRAVGVTADGKFGSKTKAAVIAYQKAHGLVADGVVGIKTWKVILGV